MRQRRKVQVHDHRAPGRRIPPQEHKLAACILWHRHKIPHSDLLVRELELAPTEPFVCRKQDMVCRLLVVDDNDDRARVTKLPQMRVLVHFFPCEPTIPGQECIALGIRSERFTHVANCHHDPDNRWAAVCRTGIEALRVSVNMKPTALNTKWVGLQRELKQIRHTTDVQEYF